ncbi:peptidase domain-containing ABC transporter [Salmonella enterica]|nr:peptidase domain-containing ABC transporter [Salmonella enterica]EJT5351210.1 peptidase domain-containing ABC transporter [Salmonella enterica]ELF2257946.1 peptidase domain-containing ABC transporter [Salmonella enterica]
MSKHSIKNLFHQLDIRLRNRVPLVHQTESSECGLACLAMICGHYGKNVDLINLRRQFNLSSRGTTLAGVTNIAEQLGLSTRPLSLDLDEIKALKMPCILHWEFNHFVVLISVKRNRVVLNDPARGQRTVSLAELSKSFTGVALEVWPSSIFTTNTVRNRISLYTLMKSVHGLKVTLGKIFFLSLVIETINLMMPVGTQLVMDHVIPASDRGLLTLICVGLLVLILMRAAVSMIRAWSSLVMATLINIQWQYGLFNHLLRLPLNYFERRKLGDIHSRFGSLNTLRETFTGSIVGALMDSIMSFGALGMMVLYGGWLTGVVIFFTTLYVLLRLFTYSSYRQLSEEALVRSARADSYFMETLYGIATIKMQGMAERRCRHWLNLEIDTTNTEIKVTKMDMLFGGINTFIAACDQVMILWLGTSLVIDNQMTIGMFIAFGVFRGQFSDCIGSLTEFLLRLRMMSLHNERVSDIALYPTENRKPEVINSRGSSQPASLVIRNLSYRYDSNSLFIFKGLDITIKAGECVAIVGASGAGKTTLMKVLCGLFVPEEGKIEVNGMDIQLLGINNYHGMIASVMQNDKLFSGSIMENICCFINDVDEDWMRECAKMSFLHEDIMKMPMGYETLIGELGEGLSGGQMQRLFIARAIYKKPHILFMDEATSALDYESENYVTQALKNLHITKVIIAHREETIRAADRVISMEKLN